MNAAVDRKISNHRVVSLSLSNRILGNPYKDKTHFLVLEANFKEVELCVFCFKIIQRWISRERVRVFEVLRVDPAMDSRPERRDIAFRRRQRRPERPGDKKRRLQR